MRRSAPVQSLIRDAGLDVDAVYDMARAALDEDLGGGLDVTTEATIPASRESVGDVVARTEGVVAGIPVAAAVFDARLRTGLPGEADERIQVRRADGDLVRRGEPVLTVSGATRQLLTAERCALNLLSHLSGVATLTRRWVDAVAGTGAVVRDTRKTMPGLRELQKYAVRCGGGSNHRMGLADAALIKDNHVRAAGGVAAALAAVRERRPHLPCEVECDTLEEVREALHGGARLVLLDNMSAQQLRSAVDLARSYGAATEASGGLTLAGVRAAAASGVDYLAVGALTHSAPVLDLALDLR